MLLVIIHNPSDTVSATDLGASRAVYMYLPLRQRAVVGMTKPGDPAVMLSAPLALRSLFESTSNASFFLNSKHLVMEVDVA